MDVKLELKSKSFTFGPTDEIYYCSINVFHTLQKLETLPGVAPVLSKQYRARECLYCLFYRQPLSSKPNKLGNKQTQTAAVCLPHVVSLGANLVPAVARLFAQLLTANKLYKWEN